MTHNMLRPTARLQIVLTLLATSLVASAARVSAGPHDAGMTRPQQAAVAASRAGSGLVIVTVGFTTTAENGATGATAGSAGGGSPLRPGQSMTIGVEAGSSDSADLCGSGIGGAVDPAKSHALHLWNVTVQPVAVVDENITINVDWKRFDAVSGGGYESHVADRRAITLKDGERHVFDFVSAPAGSASHCANLLVHVEAAIFDDPALANTTLGYDLWLVDQDSAGNQVTRHMEIAGKHREKIDFRFLPIGWSADGSPAPDNRRPDIFVELSGTLKGLLQPDGSVQLTVRPSRTVRVGDMTGSTGYREQILTAKPGETIRMDIPPSGPAPVRSHKTSLSLTMRVR